ncbi:MAG: dTDP-4-dehydrorhamnose reductase [Candidatus Diapherotrites archaeon]|nr:dTDP-4-dehydrorhamnose reductase [Candidatus Diapherotrites archaeon]
MLALILGGGFLGEKIARIFSSEGFAVRVASIDEKADIKADITKPEELDDLFASYKPKIVFLTAALSNVDYCEQHSNEAFEVNVNGTRNVVELCKKFNAKLIFFSTDYVFDGLHGNYAEEDRPNPINVYGRTKLEAEKIIFDYLDSAIVLRISTLYGYNSKDDKMHFLKWLLAALTKGQIVKVVTDQITCPTLIDDVATACLKLIEKQQQGLFHCTGSKAISRYEFAMLAAEKFGLDTNLIKKAKMQDMDWVAKRPKNSSLNINKISSLGIKMRSPEDGLSFLASKLKASDF